MPKLPVASALADDAPSISPEELEHFADFHPLLPSAGAGTFSAYHGRSVTGFSPGPGSGGQSPPRDSASSSRAIES